MEENLLLLNFLENNLGKAKKTANHNYAFMCPNNCHPTKPKLEINLSTHKYQCWICGGQKEGLKGQNILKIFKKIGLSSHKLSELKKLLGSSSILENILSNNEVELPKEFVPLSTTHINKAYNYITSRGLTKDDIIKYNIGYCESGVYANMIIIPSYSCSGKLNYFTARSLDENAFNKYRNPNVSRDIIPFELYINWNLPIILCEGPFDAMAIKRNAIPLFGKNIQPSLMKKIITSAVKKIYIALDSDAMKKAIKFAEEFKDEGKEVYLVNLNSKDPSELGFFNFTELIQQVKPLTSYNLLETKLSLI
jgi:DNA primase